jgi:hypothetical protein
MTEEIATETWDDVKSISRSRGNAHLNSGYFWRCCISCLLESLSSETRLRGVNSGLLPQQRPQGWGAF